MIQWLVGITGVIDVDNPLGSGVTHFNAFFGKFFMFKSFKDFHVHGCNHYNCKRYCSWEFDKVDFSYLTETMLRVMSLPSLIRLTWHIASRSEDSEIKTTPSIQEKAKSEFLYPAVTNILLSF